MEALTRKNISRTALRRHCKNLESDIKCLLSDFPADGAVKLKALKLNYENQIKRIDAVSDEIVGMLTTEQDLEADMEECLVLSDIFYSTLALIDEK